MAGTGALATQQRVLSSMLASAIHESQDPLAPRLAEQKGPGYIFVRGAVPVFQGAISMRGAGVKRRQTLSAVLSSLLACTRTAGGRLSRTPLRRITGMAPLI